MKIATKRIELARGGTDIITEKHISSLFSHHISHYIPTIFLMLIVGLTGGIATGKSTVSKSLHEKHGLSVIDADLIAREVVNPGKSAYKQIVETFKDVPNLVNEDQTLNRAELGKAVFGNKERIGQLNGIVHPAVKTEMVWQLLAAYARFQRMVILDVPLLFESGINMICGVTVTVSCSLELQIDRLLARNPELSADDAQKRILSQLPNEIRNYRSDLIIDNSKDLAALESEITAVVKEVRPSLLLTILDYFPPFGLISALYTFTVRAIRDKYKGKVPPKKND